MRTVLLASAFALGSVGGAVAQAMSAQDFVTEAASGGLFEVRSSEIALERSQADEVRSFAEMMIADHSAANEQLTAIATEQGLEVPAEPAGAAAEHLAAVEEAEGEGFDATYIEHQLAAHESAVELFRGYAESGDNAQLVTFATETLPTLEQHLETVQGLAAE